MFKSLLKNNPLTGLIEGEHEFNREMAKRSEQDAIFQAKQRRRQGENLMHAQIAAYGASGVELSGSALDVVKQDLIDSEIEAMNIIYSGKLKRKQMEYQADLGKSKAYLGLVKDGAMLAMKGGVGGGGGAASSGGFHSASTGTNGYTISGGGTGGGNIA